MKNVTCAALVIIGLAMVHYTVGEGIDHHQEWAEEHGLPGPSFGIFAGGAALTVVGAFALGFRLGRRR